MTSDAAQQIGAAVHAVLPLAESLFRDLLTNTADGDGISRETYGEGEQYAHDLLSRTARDLDLEVSTDCVGNLYMTMPGRDREVPGWITGSHLDSVPNGGNYDGAAGVIAGITALAAFRQQGHLPARDVTVMGIRAEEASSWYKGDHGSHLGSRAVLGLLSKDELDSAVSIRTGRSVADHIREAGFDPSAIAPGRRHLSPADYRGFLELHIEQGPVLDNKGIPVGIVTGIRGSARARNARCLGAYTHSGAVPHEYRSDALLATVELCHRMDLAWEEIRRAGGDLVFTVGKLFTDSAAHSITKVPGEVNFTIDLRSQDLATMKRMTALAENLAAEIGARRRVAFEIGKFNIATPAIMNGDLQSMLADGARALHLTTMDLPCGAGHDAQDFALAGFPAAMIFVRNANGSHNPNEAMELGDFELGTRLLAWALQN